MRNRIIDQLRVMFPGEWRYNAPVWESEHGFNVYRRDDLTNCFGEPRYFRSDTGGEIPLLPNELEIITDFARKIEQQPMSARFSKIIADNFWDLV
ncbi:MAG: hypothetical protein WC505_07580 [Patescibacteria group bacterium]